MKKILSKISFCSIIILSCVCFTYVNTTDLSTDQKDLKISEIQAVNDKTIGSVKTASILFAKVLDLLAHRGDA